MSRPLLPRHPVRPSVRSPLRYASRRPVLLPVVCAVLLGMTAPPVIAGSVARGSAGEGAHGVSAARGHTAAEPAVGRDTVRRGTGQPPATRTGRSLAVRPLEARSRAAATGATGAAGPAGFAGAGAEVVRLSRQVETAHRRYRAGRSAARAQRAEVERLERRLADQRARTVLLRRRLGRLARTQYRTGGQLPHLSQLLTVDDPEALLRGRHAVSRTVRNIGQVVTESLRAERTLAAGERRAVAASRALELRTARLDKRRRSAERKLEAARERLQDEAADLVAAGKCPPVVRPARDAPPAKTAWVLPVDHYWLSAGYDSEGAHWAHRHTGQDFAVPLGTPVRAVGAGRVVRVACGGPFGIQVVLRHPDGSYTQYAHLSALAVAPGEEVITGQWIAQSGSTGNSTGPHLHFEVRRTPESGSAVDPLPWLEERGLTP